MTNSVIIPVRKMLTEKVGIVARYTFGEIVRRRREQLGISQGRLAELIAVSQSTLARWEQRNIPPKDEEAIGAIAQHLRLDMDVLLGIMEEQAEDVEGDELVTPTSRNARLWEKFAAHFKAGDPETFAEVVASLPKNDQAMLVRLAKLLDIESKLG